MPSRRPPIRLIELARLHWASPSVFKSEFAHPWLIWSSATPGTEADVDATIATGEPIGRSPVAGAPLALPVVHRPDSKFDMGVTVGRADTNDVVIPLEDVSRFHGYFHEKNREWFLVDANSRNGTFVRGERITPARPAALGDECEVRFGGVAVQFMTSKRLEDYLLRHVPRPSTPS